MNIQCVLFDLDGTLLDTSYDFTFALNQTCRHYNAPALHYQTVRQVVSQGGLAMTQLAFPGLAGAELEARRAHFLDIYAAHIAEHTQLFPGLAPALTHITQQSIPWGIVTNKPTWLTEKLMDQLDLPQPHTLVCGDTLPTRKPDPDPLWLAAEACGCPPKQCMYIGDHPRDIEAGRNAGMLTGAALFGYLPPGADDAAWPADVFFETPIELTRFLCQQLSKGAL